MLTFTKGRMSKGTEKITGKSYFFILRCPMLFGTEC